MSMTSVVVGKLYYGRVHDYKSNKGKENEQDRVVFRASLNYRDRTNGEYINIDAVCWKDYGDKNGLVGWLEQSFLAEDGPKQKDGKGIGGQPILVNGYIRPTKKEMTAKLNVKKGGKPTTIEVKGVPYDTYEFIIESADFVPQAEVVKRDNKKSVDVDDDFEDIDADEIEVITGNDDAPESSDSNDDDDELFDN